MTLVLCLLLFVYSSSAWWEMDAVTGWVWDASKPATACTVNAPASSVDEPMTTDGYLNSRMTAKLQNSLPNSDMTATPSPFQNTFMNLDTYTSLCPAWQGQIYAYSAFDGLKGVIGTASMQWGGPTGQCLIVTVNVPLICWTAWQARVGVTSIGDLGVTELPPMTGDTSIWMSGNTGSSCTRGVYKITLCPENPPAISGTGTSYSKWNLMNCYQPVYFSMHFNLTTLGYEDGWLVPLQETVNIVTSGTCTIMSKAVPGPCDSSFSSFACRTCFNGTDCCVEVKNPLYGVCSSSAEGNCPSTSASGREFACSGGACPSAADGLYCLTVQQPCPPRTRCYGKTVCDPQRGCPPGFSEDQFCFWNGASGQLKICCSQGVSYEDGTATGTPTCLNSCYYVNYALIPTSGTSCGSAGCGNVITDVGGSYFEVKYNPPSTHTIKEVRVYLVDLPARSKYTTFIYTLGATFPDTPWTPVPRLTSNSFVVQYDILRPIGSASGFTIPCNTSSFEFAISVTLQAIGSTTTTTVILPTSQQTPWGLTWTLTTRAYDGVSLNWINNTRCCKYLSYNNSGCGPVPCSNTLKFMDQLRFSAKGLEFETPRCCAYDKIIDTVVGALPEAKNNAVPSYFSASNVAAQCNDVPSSSCSVSISFVYEATDIRNVFGYYFYNPNTGALDTTQCVSGYCTVHPDLSGRNQAGCMNNGDTVTLAIPGGSAVGFFVRSGGFSWTTKTGNTGATLYPSLKTLTSGGVNVGDSQHHWVWAPFSGALLWGIEDSAIQAGTTPGTPSTTNTTAPDYNDAVLAVRFSGLWSIPGAPDSSLDPCAYIPCSTFNPYDYTNFIFTPGCISHITLDIAVGNATGVKDCTNFYAIPDGWTIAPTDDLSKNATELFGTTWISGCLITRDPVSGALTGMTPTGEPCTADVQVLANRCYLVTACSGQLLLRKIEAPPTTCNAFQYGVYCSPHSGLVYNDSLASSVSDLKVDLWPDIALTTPLYIPLYNYMQVFVLIDTVNLGHSPNCDARSLAWTVPQLQFNTGSGFLDYLIGYGITNPNSASELYSVYCPFTTNDATLAGCNPPFLGTGFNTDLNTLQALTRFLTAANGIIGWAPLRPRYLYVPTKSTAFAATNTGATSPAAATTSAYYTNVVTPLRTALRNSGVNLVFLPTSVVNSTYLTNYVCAGIPRCVVSSTITYPDIPAGLNKNLFATSVQTYSGWLSQAANVGLPLAGRLDINKVASSDPVPLGTGSFVYNIPNYGYFAYPDYQLYKVTPGPTFTITSAQASTMIPPYVVNWVVPSILDTVGVSYQLNTVLSWDVAPTLPAPVITKTFTPTSTSPFQVQIMNSIVPILDINGNLVDTIFTSSLFSPSYPADPTGWVQLATGYGGSSDGATIATPGSVALNTRFNILGINVVPSPNAYGTWTLKYRLTDGCKTSPEGTIIINFYPTNPPPTCQNYALTSPVSAGSPVTVDFTSLVTETRLFCSSPPALTTVSALNTGGCTACGQCYGSTACCQTGSPGVTGICSAVPAACPGGAAFVCSGNTCPGTSVTGFSCVPLNPTACTGSATCVGSTVCRSTGCPEGYQNGMFCLVSAADATNYQVCCSQINYPSSTLSVGIITEINPTTAGVWTVTQNGGAPVARNTFYPEAPNASPFTFTSLKTYNNPTGEVWSYQSQTVVGLSPVCTITIPTQVAYPPVLRVNTNAGAALPWTATSISIATARGSTTEWGVSVSDLNLNDVEAIWLVASPTSTYQYYSSPDGTLVKGTYTPLDPTISSLAAASTTVNQGLLSGLTLTQGANTWTMHWTPDALHPYGLAHTLTMYAVDSTGRISNQVTITLTVTNDPPVWLPTPVTNVLMGSSTPNVIWVQGTDINPDDGGKLGLSLSSLPTKGTLQIEAADGTISTVTTGTVYNYTQFGQPRTDGITNSGGTTDQTWFKLIYTPNPVTYTTYTDSFSGNFIDRSGALGPGTAQINFVIPPDTTDYSVSGVVPSVTSSFSIPAWSVQNQLSGIYITQVSLDFPTMATLTVQTPTGPVTLTDGIPATPIFIPFTGSPSGSYSFSYSYTTTQSTAINDWFTYQAVDARYTATGLNSALISPVYTATILGVPPPPTGTSVAPIAEPGTYTIPEGSSLSIPITYVAASPSDGVPGFYNTDPNGSQSSAGVTLTITSLPTLGTLYFGGSPVTLNQVVPAGSLTYVPYDTTADTADQTDSFTYTVYDPLTGLTSNPATVDITITHTDIPPTLDIVQTSLTVDRGSTGTFNVQVSDPDSSDISILMPSPGTLPLGSGTTSWSSWEVFDQNGNPVTTYTITNLPDGSAILTIPNTTPGSTYTFDVTFTPDLAYPDGQTGTLTLQAVDTEGVASATDSATVSVPVNNPPYTEDEPITLYDLPTSGTIDKGSITTASPLQIKLKGGDPDAADSTVLDFVLTSIPDLSQVWICPTSTCDATTALDPAAVASGMLFTAEPYPDGTYTSMNLWVVPAPDFYGQLSLDFYVVDPLSAVSPPQSLLITITNTNEAPTSADRHIVMAENDCVFRDCFDPVIPLSDFVPGVIGKTTITGSDPNDGQTDTLTLSFLPGGTCGWPTAAEGKFGYIDPATGDMVELTAALASTMVFDQSINWNFWFQPAPGYQSVCTDYVGAACTSDLCINFQLQDIMGVLSPIYKVDVVVIPFNEPPVSRNYEYTIPMSTDVPSVLEVTWDGILGSAIKKLFASDPDNDESQISAHSLGIVLGSVGTWYTQDGSVIPNNQITELPDRYLRYIPPPFAYSSPATSPLATLVFEVYDPEPQTSTQYTVKVFVDFEPQPVDWRGPREIRTLEETPVLINLNLPQYYYTPDTKGTAVFTLQSGPLNGKGYFYYCDQDGSSCTNITDPSIPFTIPSGGFWYMPPANPEPNYGEHFTSFNFKLEILTPDGLPDPVSTFDLVFYINVDPVNDPPTLIPISPYNITIGGSAIFDENTTTFPDSIRFIRIRFGGFDTDNALTELRAQIFTLVDKLQAAVFVCDTTHLEGGTGKEDCSDGHRLTTVEFFAPIEPENAIWEISVIGYPHWNGPLRLEFVVWDSSLSSPPAMFPVTIRPINDYPSLVGGSASVHVEYYKNARDSDSEDPENTDSGTPVPATTGRRYIRIAADRAETASYQIDDPRQVSERRLEGTTLEKNVGTQAFEPPKPDDGSDVITIYRLRLRVQDIDFFFEKSLNVTTSYIGAGINLDVNSATTEAPADAPVAKRAAASVCVLEPYHLNCIADILTLNAEISTVGFPLQLEKGADSAVVLILIDDAGSVDWQDRPLAAGFSVTIFTPEEPLGTPIAAVVILPVIAAATAAAMAAAWIALGQRAQDYAGKSFDAFAVVASTNGHQSPLYDDQGRAVVNPLFGSGAGGPGGVGQAFVPGQ